MLRHTLRLSPKNSVESALKWQHFVVFEADNLHRNRWNLHTCLTIASTWHSYSLQDHVDFKYPEKHHKPPSWVESVNDRVWHNGAQKLRRLIASLMRIAIDRKPITKNSTVHCPGLSEKIHKFSCAKALLNLLNLVMMEVCLWLRTPSAVLLFVLTKFWSLKSIFMNW